MKKLIILCSLLLALCFNIDAQCINGTKTTPIHEYGAEIVQSLDDQNLEIVRMEYDIIRTTKLTTRELSNYWTYTIAAFGDNGIKDIDIKIWTKDALGEWVLVAQDNATTSYARVQVTPSISKEYIIEIKAHSFNTGYDVGKYGLVIWHD
jgi:hypothetical protein